MRRGSDYEWTNIHTLDSSNFTCGICGASLSANEGFSGWIQPPGFARLKQIIYICYNCGGPNFFDWQDNQYPAPKEERLTFSEPVTLISPKFVEIYNQAHSAESQGLKEIAGPGYGKALEFLVKDYLIKKLPTEEAAIKSMSLNDCIQKKLDNPKIKSLADKARDMRNDETHYERKNEASDINDLKKLIQATTSWIDLESYTAEVENK